MSCPVRYRECRKVGCTYHPNGLFPTNNAPCPQGALCPIKNCDLRHDKPVKNSLTDQTKKPGNQPTQAAKPGNQNVRPSQPVPPAARKQTPEGQLSSLKKGESGKNQRFIHPNNPPTTTVAPRPVGATRGRFSKVSHDPPAAGKCPFVAYRCRKNACPDHPNHASVANGSDELCANLGACYRIDCSKKHSKDTGQSLKTEKKDPPTVAKTNPPACRGNQNSLPTPANRGFVSSGNQAQTTKEDPIVPRSSMSSQQSKAGSASSLSHKKEIYSDSPWQNLPTGRPPTSADHSPSSSVSSSGIYQQEKVSSQAPQPRGHVSSTPASAVPLHPPSVVPPAEPTKVNRTRFLESLSRFENGTQSPTSGPVPGGGGCSKSGGGGFQTAGDRPVPGGGGPSPFNPLGAGGMPGTFLCLLLTRM